MRRITLLAVALLLAVCMHADAQDQQPPKPSMIIIEPAAGGVLSGEATVRVQAKNGLPSMIVVGLPNAQWTKLTREGDAGDTWSGTIDTTLIPNGATTLLAYSNNRTVRATKAVEIKNENNVYFFDLHAHTSYSDGALIPEIAFRHARDVAKLDGFVLTDHLESVDDIEWLDLRQQAMNFNEDGKFTTLPGLEWTKKFGHMNIFDPKVRGWPVEKEAMWEAAAKADVVLQFNHPGDGSQVFDGLAYSENGDKATQLMETRTPAEETAFIRALDNGWHIAPVGTDDTHAPTWGDAFSWTGAVMPGLSKANLWNALKNRHVYSTLDRNCRLTFTANHGAYIMGDIIDEPVDSLQLAVTATDPDDGDVIEKIEIFVDGVVAQTSATSKSSILAFSPEIAIPADGEEHYCFAKVTQADGQILRSAPIWATGKSAE